MRACLPSRRRGDVGVVKNTHTHTTSSHTTLSHTVTYNFATYHLSRTTLSHTIFHTTLAGVLFAWQALHLWHWAGSGGALGPGWLPGAPRHFAWQVWHLATSTFVLRGRCGTWRNPHSICVAGVALMALGWIWWRAWSPLVARAPRHFAWQVWHLPTSTFVLCGGVALMALGWIWSRAWSPLVARGAAALGNVHLRFAWQVWHLATPTFVLQLRGSCGTCSHWLLRPFDRNFLERCWHVLQPTACKACLAMFCCIC